MDKKILTWLLATFFLTTVSLAEAQQTPTMPPICFLSPGSPSFAAPLIDAFQQGLRELGWTNGHNIIIERRYAEGKADRLQELTTELVQLNVNIIVTAGEPAIRAAKQATSTIPIVMAASSDPVGQGVVSSLGRPAGNVTGLSSFVRELNTKRLELLKEAIPTVTRVAVLWSSHSGSGISTEITSVAQALSLRLQSLEVRGPEEFDGVMRSATKARAGAVLLLRNYFILTHQTQIATLATKHRLPSVFDNSEFVAGGGVMSYGANIADSYRRAATFVDKILKGAKPADLPVEQPTKFELIINLKTAKQIGLTIPPNVLVRADKVIR
jgi:putative ABC transport system substrate-binding protein